jgi:hypothetical protein
MEDLMQWSDPWFAAILMVAQPTFAFGGGAWLLATGAPKPLASNLWPQVSDGVGAMLLHSQNRSKRLYRVADLPVPSGRQPMLKLAWDRPRTFTYRHAFMVQPGTIQVLQALVPLAEPSAAAGYLFLSSDGEAFSRFDGVPQAELQVLAGLCGR